MNRPIPGSPTTTKVPARDPETGQFVSGDGATFDDIEVASFQATVGVQAADLGGGTAFPSGSNDEFEGLLLIDYDEIVDRNESLQLLYAEHSISVYPNSTETADGQARGYAEVSASPALTMSGEIQTGDDIETANVVGEAEFDDTIDLVGRPLQAVGTGPFSDGSTGVGGGGSAGEDAVEIEHLPEEAGRFHPRDELFLNGVLEAWNVDDSGIHLDLVGQHIYGVVMD